MKNTKKICLAALILISGVVTSCMQKSSKLTVGVMLQPSTGIRKDIGTAD